MTQPPSDLKAVDESAVDAALAVTEVPPRAMRYWSEAVAVALVLVVVAFIVAAALRKHATVVVIHDVSKGSTIGRDDVVAARLPLLDAAMTSTADAIGLVAAEDLAGGTALRRKDVLRLQGVTSAALHRGDATSSANVTFKMTPFVPEAVISLADLGRVANVPIPEGTILRQPMLAADKPIATAAHDLAPFVLLVKGDVIGAIPSPAVLVRAVSAGGAIRATDVLALPTVAATNVVASYRVIAGPLRPHAGTAVLLLRNGKEIGEAVPATLLALQNGSESSTAVVALDTASAVKLGQAGGEPIHLLQSIGGT